MHDVEVHDLQEALERIEQLQTALDSRIVIEQAKGVLRERFHWPVEEAFEVLRYAARSSRMSLTALAADVVANEVTPNPIVVAIARTSRWRSSLMRERTEAQHERTQQLEIAIREQQERLAWRQKERFRHGHRPPPVAPDARTPF